MPLLRKISWSLQSRDLLMKHFYENSDFLPDALRMFGAFKNKCIGAMTANRTVADPKDSISFTPSTLLRIFLACLLNMLLCDVTKLLAIMVNTLKNICLDKPIIQYFVKLSKDINNMPYVGLFETDISTKCILRPFS